MNENHGTVLAEESTATASSFCTFPNSRDEQAVAMQLSISQSPSLLDVIWMKIPIHTVLIKDEP